MHLETDRALVLADSPTVRYLTVRITAPPHKHPAAPRPAAAVSLVLDRSGSMDGRKIEMARKATTHAIQLLNERDWLAVVIYDERVDTLLEASPASKEAKHNVLTRLAEVHARGSTDLAGGWFRGADQLRAPEPSLPVRRVLLLTDGLANHGIVDHEQLRQAAAKFRDAGITTSTFGVGADFDEQLLGAIASHGGGHFYFIETPAQIPDLLASELGETLEIVAREAAFELTCGPGVEAVVLNDLPVETSAGRLRVRLGDLIADQEVTLALAITCAARPTGSEAFVDCRVSDRDAALFSEPMRVEWRAADGEQNQQQPVNSAVLIAVADAIAERARAAALDANRRGQFDDARRILQGVVDQLRTLAPGIPQIETIIDRLRGDQERFAMPLGALATKAIYFNTYSSSRSRAPSGSARRRSKKDDEPE